MNALAPFFLLVARPAMFWIGALMFASISIVLAGLSEPEAAIIGYVEPAFLAVIVYPAACGALGGAALREFQHSTVAWPLPGVRRRFVLGYVVAGLAATLITLGLVAARSGLRPDFPTLFCVGLGSYAFGSTLFDPNSYRFKALKAVDALLVLILVVRSYDVAEWVAANSVAAAGVSLVVGGLSFASLFGRSTWRSRPFWPTSPFPGSHWLKRSESFAREKRAREKPRRRSFRADYLAVRPWSWVRAAVYHTWGSIGPRTVLGALSRTMALWLLMFGHAWIERGEFGFGNALARTVYDVLFRPPHLAPFGENAPYLIVVLVIAAVGAITTAMTPVRLAGVPALPLSRRCRARIFFRCGLVDAGSLLFTASLFLGVPGLLAGWLAGHELRFDFVPYFLRALLATIALMPLAHWAGLRLRATNQRQSTHMAALIVGLIAFIAVVSVWTLLAPRLLTTPLLELSVTVVVVLVSQGLHLVQLERYFASADLV